MTALRDAIVQTVGAGPWRARGDEITVDDLTRIFREVREGVRPTWRRITPNSRHIVGRCLQLLRTAGLVAFSAGRWGVAVPADGVTALDRARAGDRDAFAQLVGPLLGVTRRRLARALGDEAEEIVQATVVRALQHIGRFRAECDFAMWFWGLSTTEVAERARRAAAAKRSGVHVPLDALADLASPPQADGPLLWRDVQRAAVGVPQGQLDAAELVFEGCTLAEVADELGITPAAAKSRWRRARAALAEALS